MGCAGSKPSLKARNGPKGHVEESEDSHEKRPEAASLDSEFDGFTSVDDLVSLDTCTHMMLDEAINSAVRETTG